MKLEMETKEIADIYVSFGQGTSFRILGPIVDCKFTLVDAANVNTNDAKAKPRVIALLKIRHVTPRWT
jgi:hypothetical protein